MQIQRTTITDKNGKIRVRVFIAEHDELAEPLEDSEEFLSFCLTVELDASRPLLEFQLRALLEAHKLVSQETNRFQALYDKWRRDNPRG